MCSALSPGGHLRCENPTCDGRGHIWIHGSAARDKKRDKESESSSAYED